MGVDFSAHCGIGFRVKHPQSNEQFENEYGGDFRDFFYEVISEQLEELDYAYFEVGEGTYDGTENEFYVVVKGNLSDGWDEMKLKADRLKSDLWNLDLISLEDKAEIVGGLEIH